MAKATKLPSGNYRCLASRTINGVEKRKSFTAETKKEAERLAAAWSGKTPRPGKTTLRSACEQYINGKDNILSPITIQTYKSYTKRYLQDYMDRNIQNIARNDLQAAFNDLASKLSPKTVNAIYGFFRAVLAQNDFSLKITLPKAEKKEYNTADIETAKMILQAVKGTDIEIPITLALKYGMRISEICGLKWCNVTPLYIDVVNTKVCFGGKYYDKPPKTAAGRRRIPISQADYDMMIKHSMGEYVYPHCHQELRRRFDYILKENGLPHYTIHSLRHTFASVMAVANVPRAYAKSIGGWETDSTLSQIYTQTFETQQRQFMADIDSIFQQDG